MSIFRKFTHNITQYECCIRWARTMKLSFPLNNIVVKVSLPEIFDGLFCKGFDVHVRNVVQTLIQLNPYMKPRFKILLGKYETWK